MRSQRYLDVVAVGPLQISITAELSRLPVPGEGAYLNDLEIGIGSDAPRVSFLLHSLGQSTGLIANNVSSSPFGIFLLKQLQSAHILNRLKSDASKATLDIGLCTPDGKRTWVAYHSDIANQLKRADTSLATRASVLYVDCYSPLATWAARFTEKMKRYAPIFLNVGSHDLIHKYISTNSDGCIVSANLSKAMRSSWIVQVSVNEAYDATAAQDIARDYLKRGARACVITRGKYGALYISAQHFYSCLAPSIVPQNPAGAGAAFAAGFIYGHRRGWDVADSLKFGVLSGTLYCSRRAGLDSLLTHTVTQIRRIARRKVNLDAD